MSKSKIFKKLAATLVVSSLLTPVYASANSTDVYEVATAPYRLTKEQEQYWNDYERSAVKGVDYVKSIAKEKPEAAAWLVKTGGKYGHAPRLATPEEADVLCNALKVVAEYAVTYPEKKPTLFAEEVHTSGEKAAIAILNQKYNDIVESLKALQVLVVDLGVQVSELKAEVNGLRLELAKERADRIADVSRLEKQLADAEQRRLNEAAAAEQKRLNEAAAAEQKRLNEAAAAEQKRLNEAAAAEQKRLAEVTLRVAKEAELAEEKAAREAARVASDARFDRLMDDMRKLVLKTSEDLRAQEQQGRALFVEQCRSRDEKSADVLMKVLDRQRADSAREREASEARLLQLINQMRQDNAAAANAATERERNLEARIEQNARTAEERERALRTEKDAEKSALEARLEARIEQNAIRSSQEKSALEARIAAVEKQLADERAKAAADLAARTTERDAANVRANEANARADLAITRAHGLHQELVKRVTFAPTVVEGRGRAARALGADRSRSSSHDVTPEQVASPVPAARPATQAVAPAAAIAAEAPAAAQAPAVVAVTPAAIAAEAPAAPDSPVSVIASRSPSQASGPYVPLPVAIANGQFDGAR